MHEFNILNQIFRQNHRLGKQVIIPPGDDLAMVQLSPHTDQMDENPKNNHRILFGVDQLIAGQHFNPDATDLDWSLVGRKAVARSLSDIAAMAAQPVASLATAALPKDFSEHNTIQLFEGMRKIAEEYDCPLVGGDIAVTTGPLICTVTVLCQPGPTGKILTRSDAKPGDHIYVTGNLGASWRTNRHFNFTPRINLALQLVKHYPVHAMIDISDGLGRDLGHIARMSNVTCELNAACIPVHTDADLQMAISDGEDYELCFTAPSDTAIPEYIDMIKISRIGSVKQPAHADSNNTNALVSLRSPDGTTLDIHKLGWQHETNSNYSDDQTG